MQSKLKELTDKIYKEGVNKGNEEAEKIISDAKNEAAKIIKEANNKADSIVKEAQKKSDELSENTKKEIKLSSKKIINTVKQQLTDLINSKVIEPSIKNSMKDKEFIKNIIFKIADNWNPDKASETDLNVFLPEKDQKELSEYYKSLTAELLKQGIKLNFDGGLKSGFQISPKDGSYKISFSEEEFNNFFKDFFRPKLVELIFGK
jgi:V/A-type H+-transporting ATPase subunit E